MFFDYNPNNGKMYVCENAKWTEIKMDKKMQPSLKKVYASCIEGGLTHKMPPTKADEGALWYDTGNDKMYVYNGTEWICTDGNPIGDFFEPQKGWLQKKAEEQEI